MDSEKSALLLSAVTHLLWGLHPVCSRYLQTRPSQPLDGLNLLAVGQVCALVINLASSVVAKCWDKEMEATDELEPVSGRDESGHGFSGGENIELVGTATTPLFVNIESDCAPETDSKDSTGLATGIAPFPTTTSSWGVFSWSSEAKRVACFFGSMAATRAATNMLSARFTKAYNVALVSMAGPLVTALLSSAMIGEVVPWTLWPALAVAAGGEALVLSSQAGLLRGGGRALVGGDVNRAFGSELRLLNSSNSSSSSSSRSRSGITPGAEDMHSGGGGGLSNSDWLGLGLQFTSLWFSGLSRIAMSSSKGLFTPSELLAVQYSMVAFPGLVLSSLPTLLPPPPPASTSTSTSSDDKSDQRGSVWGAWLSLDLADAAVFAVLVGGVMVLAATMQVHAIRTLGPSGHTAQSPLRLLSTLAGSALLLDEPLSGPWEWGGLSVVLLSLTWYITVGKQLQQQQQLVLPSSLSPASTSKREGQVAAGSAGGGGGGSWSLLPLSLPQLPPFLRPAVVPKHMRRRRWFQVLLWPRPSYRPGGGAQSQQRKQRMGEEGEKRGQRMLEKEKGARSRKGRVGGYEGMSNSRRSRSRHRGGRGGGGGQEQGQERGKGEKSEHANDSIDGGGGGGGGGGGRQGDDGGGQDDDEEAAMRMVLLGRGGTQQQRHRPRHVWSPSTSLSSASSSPSTSSSSSASSSTSLKRSPSSSSSRPNSPPQPREMLRTDDDETGFDDEEDADMLHSLGLARKSSSNGNSITKGGTEKRDKASSRTRATAAATTAATAALKGDVSSQITTRRESRKKIKVIDRTKTKKGIEKALLAMSS